VFGTGMSLFDSRISIMGLALASELPLSGCREEDRSDLILHILKSLDGPFPHQSGNTSPCSRIISY